MLIIMASIITQIKLFPDYFHEMGPQKFNNNSTLMLQFHQNKGGFNPEITRDHDGL